jgi:NDP-sugar pyrophosphorylase family protein
MNKINVFILAAGLGERLRPITDHIPKPLVPILGRPALQHVVDRISELPFRRIGINLHHKKEVIEKWLAECPLSEKIEVFVEKKTLGTGGALKNAGNLLGEGTFLVHNSDIISDIDLEQLLKYHASSKNLVTLAVHNYVKFNSLVVDGNGLLKGMGGAECDGILAFTGIAVYEPGFLDFLQSEESGVVDAWLKAVNAGSRVGTFNVSGCSWSDIGTPGAYASTVFSALRAEGENVYFHPSVKKCPDLGMQGYIVIEQGCDTVNGRSLKNCILLPGTKTIPAHSPVNENEQRTGVLENCIIGPGYKIDINSSKIPLLTGEGGKQLIGTGGSDRRYYRIDHGSSTAVLMQCRQDDPDFERHIEFATFLLKLDIPVPELLEINSDSRQALFEDAGDISLYSFLKCPREDSQIESIYMKIIDALVLIHTRAAQNSGGCPLIEERVFDYGHFRWETDYFINMFVKGMRNISVQNELIDNELHLLALRADSFPKTIIHRDFQSQNIMIMNGRQLRVIDYQGARKGPPAYDAASLLQDPYYRIRDDVRERLLEYYINRMQDTVTEDFDSAMFKDSLTTCSLQRHMQALGAYAFLSAEKGKKYFLKYIPEGLRLLKEDIAVTGNEYPELFKLIREL